MLTLGDTDSDIDGLTLDATAGLDLTEYGDEVADGLTLSLTNGEVEEEYKDVLGVLTEEGVASAG